MGKLIKGILGILALGVAILVIAAVALTALFDPNDYKDTISQQVREKTGIELQINGAIDWSFFPWLGLTVADIQAGFSERDTLANLASAQLYLQLPALLSGQIEMRSIVIDGMQLNLVKDAKGQVNWQSAQSAKTDTPVQTQPAGAQNTLPLQLDIASIELTNSQITYTDLQSKRQLTLQDLNLSTGRISADTPFDIKLTTRLKEHVAGALTQQAELDLQANVQLALAAQRYQINQLEGELVTQGDAALKLALEGRDIRADLANNLVDIPSLSISRGPLKLQGELHITDLNTLALNGQLQAEPFALNPVLESLGLPTHRPSDNNALRHIRFASTFAGDGKSIKTNTLTLQIDDTELTGAAALQMDSGHITLNLTGNSIDLDRYLTSPNTAGTPAKAAQTTSQGYSKEEIIPLAPLRALNLTASLKMAAVSINKMALKHVDVALDAKEGLVKLPRLNAQLFAGQLNNQIVLDARREPLNLTSKVAISGVQIDQLLAALSPDQPPALTGTLDTRADLRSAGQSVHSLVNQLNGKASVSLIDGVIKGIDAAQQVCQTLNNLSSLGSFEASQQVDGTTPFARADANLAINNGVVSNDDLKVQLDAMQVKGSGQVNLPVSSLDYQLALIIEENLFKKTCSVNNRLEGVEWPVRCKGSFDTPPLQLCKPDARAIRAALKDAASAKVKEKVSEKLEEKLQEKLGDKLKGEAGKSLIKGLFK